MGLLSVKEKPKEDCARCIAFIKGYCVMKDEKVKANGHCEDFQGTTEYFKRYTTSELTQVFRKR